MPRIPPALLALGVVVLVVAGVGIAFALQGPGSTSSTTCTDAQQAGPYGCVTFVSERSSQTRYLLERRGSATVLVTTSGCGSSARDVTVARTRFSGLGAPTTQQGSGCTPAQTAQLAALDRLFLGAVRVAEHDDATVTITNGSRSEVFQEVLAQR